MWPGASYFGSVSSSIKWGLITVPTAEIMVKYQGNSLYRAFKKVAHNRQKSRKTCAKTIFDK